jgi:xanthine dehydrogenase YagR molybdenum-binding subunit
MQTAPAPVPAGKSIDRVDGRAKVTGGARYAADAPVQGFAYATLVQSTIAKGTIKSIDTSLAMVAPGVLTILTHEKKPDVATPKPDFQGGGVTAEQRMPLVDNVIHHAGQHIAVVVAKTIEQSKHAASLLKVEYASETAQLDPAGADVKVISPKEFFGEPLSDQVGDFDKAFADAAVKFTATYTTPSETHNPMEPSATVAHFEGDRLTVYDATQWVVGTRAILADLMKLPRENVRVISPYVGGGFGCKGFIWPHTMLAVMAAKQAGVPVKLPLSRSQMFTSSGHRPQTSQTMTIGASADGTISAIKHSTRVQGSTVGQFVEPCAMGTTRSTYKIPNIAWHHEIVPLDLPEPTFMRAPGESPGSFALESAMDELAIQLNIDPVELRLKHFAKEKNPASGQPVSTNYLDECYAQAAERFGWSKRNPKPMSMRDGDLMIGYGMATAMYPGNRFGGQVRIRLMADGRAIVSTSAHEMGQGTYTALTQVASDALGIDDAMIKVELGDSVLPPGPLAGGSNQTATCSVMIYQAAEKLAEQLGKKGENGQSLVEAVKASGKPFEDAMGTSMPGPEMQQYSFASKGCHFVEIAIDPLSPRVQVRRVVSMFDVGRIISPKQARSQGIGGIIMGIGMALTEATHYDGRTGRTVNDNLADYAVPVNADIPDIEVMFTDKADLKFNPSGVRGVGEIPITGVAAAIANAVYHATGVRVRDLPILPHKVIAHA